MNWSRLPCIPFSMRRTFVPRTRLIWLSLWWHLISVFSTILDTTVLWKQIIQRGGGVITNALNVSCLAKVTDGFTQGHIVQVVKGVLTERRLRQQTYKPLTAVEFIAALTSTSPVYQEEEDSFKVSGMPAPPAHSSKHLSRHPLPVAPRVWGI